MVSYLTFVLLYIMTTFAIINLHRDGTKRDQRLRKSILYGRMRVK